MNVRPAAPSAVEQLGLLFERLGGWSFDHRLLVLGACAVVLGTCAGLTQRARFDNSFEAYFDTDDPAYRAYQLYREDFGSDETAYILYAVPDAPHGPFDLDAMRRIARLTEALEDEVPFVDEVTSLANVEHVLGVEDGLEVGELLEEWPQTQQELLALRAVALDEPLYVGGILAADARHAAIVLEMSRSSVDPLEELRLDPAGGDGLENLYPQVSYRAIESVLARPEYAGIEFHHVGDVALNAVYNLIVASESAALGAVSFAVIAALLLFFFRTPIGVLGPLAVVGLAIVVALGFVGLLEWKLDLMFVMLPTLLIAVGVADGVHVIAEFRAHHAELGDRREAMRRTLRLVGAPCLLTSLTTAAGFLSMSVAPIVAISHFAVYSAIGVLGAFALSMTLLVGLLSFGRRELRASGRARLRARGGPLLQRGLAAVARFDCAWRRSILVFFALVFALSAAGIARLRVDSNFLNEFAEDEPIRRATAHADDVMGGTYSFIYLFDSGEPDGVKDPQLLRDVERLQRTADAKPLVRKTYSVSDLLKDLNRSFHAEDASHYRLPEARDLVAQYLLVYELSGGEELSDYISGDHSRASLELRCKADESSVLGRMAGELDAYLAEQPVRSAEVSVTGIGALWLQLEDYITRSQIRGFLLAFAVIAALLCFIFRSLTTGLLAMVPNLSPVVLTLGAMGWADVPLDYVRLLIGSVAIGIAVDDTIHHVTRFRGEFLRCGRYREALEASMADVGRALVITSVVLVAGFLVFLGSALDSLASFGLLLAATIGVALLADFLLMPALVLTLRPWGPEREPEATDLEGSSGAATP